MLGITKSDRRQLKIYVLLSSIVILAKLAESFFGVSYDGRRLNAPIFIIIIYLILGLLGIYLNKKELFPKIFNFKLNNYTQIFSPFFLGLIFGLILVVSDFTFFREGFGYIPQEKFPQNILVVIIAGVTEEIVFRLFLISLIYIVLKKIIRNKETTVFWLSNLGSASTYSVLSYLALSNTLNFNSITLGLILFLSTNIMYGLTAGLLLKRNSFTSTLSLRFGLYIIWHILWPAIQ